MVYGEKNWNTELWWPGHCSGVYSDAACDDPVVVANLEGDWDGTAWVDKQRLRHPAERADLRTGAARWVAGSSSTPGWTRPASLTPYRDGAVVFQRPSGSESRARRRPLACSTCATGSPTGLPRPQRPAAARETSARSPYEQRFAQRRGFIGIHGLTARPRPGPDLARHPIEERRDSEIGQLMPVRTPVTSSVTGRKRDWRKLVGARLVAVVVVAGAPTAVADGGSTTR